MEHKQESTKKSKTSKIIWITIVAILVVLIIVVLVLKLNKKTNNVDKPILLLRKLIIVILVDWKIRSSAAFSLRASRTIFDAVRPGLHCKGTPTRPTDQTI